MSRNTSVFGIYRDRPSVEEAVDTLRAAGFRNTDISVLFQENEGTKDLAHEKNTKAPEGDVAWSPDSSSIAFAMLVIYGVLKDFFGSASRTA